MDFLQAYYGYGFTEDDTVSTMNSWNEEPEKSDDGIGNVDEKVAKKPSPLKRTLTEGTDDSKSDDEVDTVLKFCRQNSSPYAPSKKKRKFFQFPKKHTSFHRESTWTNIKIDLK